MKKCSICNTPYYIKPFHQGYICEDCIKYLKKRHNMKIVKCSEHTVL